jgi:hypothetical protein
VLDSLRRPTVIAVTRPVGAIPPLLHDSGSEKSPPGLVVRLHATRLSNRDVMIDVTRVGIRDRTVSLLRARMSRNEHHRTPLRYAGRKTALGSFSCRRLVQRGW